MIISQWTYYFIATHTYIAPSLSLSLSFSLFSNARNVNIPNFPRQTRENQLRRVFSERKIVSRPDRCEFSDQPRLAISASSEQPSERLYQASVNNDDIVRSGSLRTSRVQSAHNLGIVSLIKRISRAGGQEAPPTSTSTSGLASAGAASPITPNLTRAKLAAQSVRKRLTGFDGRSRR